MYTSSLKMHVDQKSRSSYYRMIILGIVLVMPTFLSAVNHTYPAIALPQMKLDMNATSWFASVSIFASPLSIIIIGFLIDRFGRKVTLLYCIAPSIGGWLLLYWEYNVPLILLGQALNGLSMSTGYYPIQVYAGECLMADNIRMRNVFMTWIGLSTSIGTTVTLIMGNIFNYHEICLLMLVISISMLFTFFLVIPESPVWLYRKGRTGDAEWSQKRLGITQSIFKSTMKKQSELHVQDESSCFTQLQKIIRPDVYKPTFILSMICIVFSLCGTTTVTTYVINVIQNTVPGGHTPQRSNQTNDSISQTILGAQDELQLSYQLSLYGGLFMCLGSLLSVPGLPRLGLKKMLITTKSCFVLAMLIVFLGSEVKPDGHIVFRVVGVAIIAFLMGFEVGPRMSFLGDVFPVDAKGFASIPTFIGSIFKAISYKMFPYLRAEFGGYIFCIFAAMSFIATFLIYFFVPEVVGRTLEDINKEYADEVEK